jgi:hypothetical protein
MQAQSHVMVLTSSSKQVRLRQLGGFSGPRGSVRLMRFDYDRASIVWCVISG